MAAVVLSLALAVGQQGWTLQHARELTFWRRAVRGLDKRFVFAARAHDSYTDSDIPVRSTFRAPGEEGTSVESATEWATPSGYGTYLDALHELLP